jgi:hypothetical protein
MLRCCVLYSCFGAPQELDSFWRGNASHIDFFNVQLERKGGGSGTNGASASLGDMVLKVYLPDAAERQRVQARMAVDRQLLHYKKASTDLPTPSLEFVDGLLDPATCGTVWDGSTLLDSPWYHNVFHLHAKNTLPTALVLATTPTLVRGGACVSVCRRQAWLLVLGERGRGDRHVVHNCCSSWTCSL